MPNISWQGSYIQHSAKTLGNSTESVGIQGLRALSLLLHNVVGISAYRTKCLILGAMSVKSCGNQQRL
jgi:hypothetical protein